MILHHLTLATLMATLGVHHVMTSPSGHYGQGQEQSLRHHHHNSEESESSVLFRIGDEMIKMLGLSKADIEELKVDSLSLFIKLLSETIYF